MRLMSHHFSDCICLPAVSLSLIGGVHAHSVALLLSLSSRLPRAFHVKKPWHHLPPQKPGCAVHDRVSSTCLPTLVPTLSASDLPPASSSLHSLSLSLSLYGQSLSPTLHTLLASLHRLLSVMRVPLLTVLLGGSLCVVASPDGPGDKGSLRPSPAYAFTYRN